MDSGAAVAMSLGAEARMFWGVDPEDAPAELPPVCCSRCEHFAAVVAGRGVCRWPKPEDWPASFGSRLMAAPDGTNCAQFVARKEMAAPEVTP